MTKRGERIPAGAWPKAMRLARAADYCDVSPGFFKAHCDVQPIELGGVQLWHRDDLDGWLDRLREGTVGGYDPIDEALENAGSR